MLKYHFKADGSSFAKSLRQKVDVYFAEKGIRQSGNWRLFLKSGIVILSSAALYTVLVFFTPIVPVSIALCLLLGVNLALIGFNVMHEGGHQAFSSRPWLNNASSYFLNILGGISYYWKIKHNINHHTYTNVDGMDSDIDVKPFMRLHPEQPLRSYHYLQNWYWIILYGISYLAWVFYEDFVKYFSGKISVNSVKKSLPLKEHFAFWLTKVLYILFYIVIPILRVGWLPWLVGFLIITVVCGIVISVVFQLAHVVGGTHFHSARNQGDDTQEWAIHQVETTSNFGTSDKVLHWLLGGLNFQIEHHLFPRISHIHYPAISKIVRETCVEYSIVYNEYSSMWRAVRAHLRHLRQLGRA